MGTLLIVVFAVLVITLVITFIPKKPKDYTEDEHNMFVRKKLSSIESLLTFIVVVIIFSIVGAVLMGVLG